MKIYINFIMMALFTAILFTVSISSADSPPLVPNTFSGTVKFKNSSDQFDAPAGTLVEALIDNVTKGSTTVITPGSYMIDVSGTYDDDGKDITFKANNLNSEQKAFFNATMPSPRTLNLIINLSSQTPGFPPASVINIQAFPGTTWINWSWINPPDSDFSHVMLYLNGSFIINISGLQNFYNTTGLSPVTSYELGTRTVDTSGNINQTWVNRTAKTLSSGELRGDINRNNILDTGDATLILRSIVGLPIPSQYMPILPIGDMNCNGKIDTGDATLVLRDIVKLPIPRCWE